MLFGGPLLVASCTRPGAVDWRTASRAPTNILPAAAAHDEAVVAVLAARAWGWRGAFAVHTWVVMKPKGATRYDRYEVVGWGVQQGVRAVRQNMRPPDAPWAGNQPTIVHMVQGDAAEQAIPEIEAAIARYPYPESYVIWPGPNSNTFIAYLIRQVPELAMEMPAHAVGKDWIANGVPFAAATSRTGVQLSLFGVLGLTVALAEGIEVNLLGLVVGIDPMDLAIKLPGIGRIGWR
ncbi:MAG TPA: DUF3750 domain-containing protein [Geminicoccus sp.]|uniref:DUF3750 domain-containing protein n=1 Tax=Geminicoccus sp. TaxID=2024832 RepID=UPI002E3617AA|nr:DUF3750 domain-containing protein [Geminicoccus sp.]HEX2528064.1 DUF3750 domain-containing protein [Geminicoccus sp.]